MTKSIWNLEKKKWQCVLALYPSPKQRAYGRSTPNRKLVSLTLSQMQATIQGRAPVFRSEDLEILARIKCSLKTHYLMSLSPYLYIYNRPNLWCIRRLKTPNILTHGGCSVNMCFLLSFSPFYPQRVVSILGNGSLDHRCQYVKVFLGIQGKIANICKSLMKLFHLQ